jgi:hypothetical protein
VALSPTAEDGKDLMEHCGGRLAPFWLGRPHCGQHNSGVNEQRKHAEAASGDLQFVDGKGSSQDHGNSGCSSVHEHDNAGRAGDRLLSPERCGTLRKTADRTLESR